MQKLMDSLGRVIIKQLSFILNVYTFLNIVVKTLSLKSTEVTLVNTTFIAIYIICFDDYFV